MMLPFATSTKIKRLSVHLLPSNLYVRLRFSFTKTPSRAATYELNCCHEALQEPLI